MQDLLRTMDFSSFWTIWFWVLHVITWSLISHFPMGVPYDMVQQADRAQDDDSDVARHCHLWTKAAAFRMTDLFQKFGVIVTSVWFFLLSSVAMLGFFTGIEFFRGLFTILLPLTLIYAISVQIASRLVQSEVSAQEARHALRRQRLYNQVVGIIGLSMAAVFAIFEVLHTLSPFWF